MDHDAAAAQHGCWIAAVGIIGGVVATAWQARIARAQAEQAGKNSKKAERIGAFLLNVFSYAEPNASARGGGRSPNVKLEDALRDAENRLEGELKDEPETKAELHITLGNVWQMRGDFVSAEAHFRQSLALRRQLHGERHPQVARCLFLLSRATYQLRGQEGERMTDDFNYQAMMMMKELDPTNELLPRMLLNHGSRAGNRGDFQTGEAGILEAQRLFNERYGAQHHYTMLTTVRLAELYKQRGELDRARAAYRDYLNRSSHLPPDAERANALGNIGIIEFLQGQDTAAEKTLHQSLAIFREYLGNHHPHSLGVRQTLALLYCRRGQLNNAETEARHALEVAQSKYSPHSSFVISTLLILSKVLIESGRSRYAAPFMEEAAEKYHKLRDTSPRDSFTSAGILGECLTLLKRYEEAEELLKESYNGLQPIRGMQSPEMVGARHRLAQLYDAWGKPEQAAQFR